MPKPSRPDGWLAEWVRNTTPQPTPRPPKRIGAPAQPGDPKYITLQEWAARMFGDNAPHANTLLRWAREGLIQPQARKIGGRWFVYPTAEYVE